MNSEKQFTFDARTIERNIGQSRMCLEAIRFNFLMKDEKGYTKAELVKHVTQETEKVDTCLNNIEFACESIIEYVRQLERSKKNTKSPTCPMQ